MSPWSVVFRYTLFSTESYDCRIYNYEQDIQGAYSLPSFSGKGSKAFILFNFKLMRKASVSLRFSQLVYDDRNVIGSGNDEISGFRKSEVKMMFLVKI